MGSISNTPDYTTLDTPIPGAPPVLLFFSFLDPTAYEWATKYQVAQRIRESVRNGTELHRYHVSSTDKSGWNYGYELTHAWSVASHLRVDDQVIVPLFQAIRKDKSATDLEGIREVFESVGIGKARFDQAWNDPSVMKFLEWQEELSRQAPREYIPCVVVKGKYVVKADQFDSFEEETFGKQVAEVVKDLLAKE